VLSATATGSPTFKWQHNGADVAGAASANLALDHLQPADTGIYSAIVTNSSGSATSNPAIVGLTISTKVVGAGSEIAAQVKHPNGNIFDQVLASGTAFSFTADAGEATRCSFIDLLDNIVQIEFSGAGTVSVVLAGSSPPAAPVNYNQPAVAYMKGHAGIVVSGANETTNMSIFTVGRATAFDPTGGYNILQGPSATNVPANNGSSLFVGHANTSYDGFANIAFVAIASTNGKFGGLRTSNATYWADQGITGVYAPGVEFTGPVFVGDINAKTNATPYLQIGQADVEVRITGGDLLQDNSRPIQVTGFTQLKFAAGSDSNGNILSPKTNRGVLMQNGTDVTAQLVPSQ